MAIRAVTWQVSEDGMTLFPCTPQNGGVQGEDNATELVFGLSSLLMNPAFQLYIECIDASGEYDKTDVLEVAGNTVRTLVPLAWTQFGGVSLIRLVAENKGEIVYTLEGKLVFSSRQTAGKKVDGLLRTHIQTVLNGAEAAQEEAVSMAGAAAGSASSAARSEAAAGARATDAGAARDQAAESAQQAEDKAALASVMAANAAGSAAEAAEQATRAQLAAAATEESRNAAGDYARQTAAAVEEAVSMAGAAAGSASSAARSEAQAALRATESGTARDQATESAKRAEDQAEQAAESAAEAAEYRTAAEAAQAKAEEAAASAAASAAVSEWKQDAANAIKGTPIGGAISLTDISPIEHDVKIQVFSDNLIPNSYPVEQWKTNGTTADVNDDGSITLVGVPQIPEGGTSPNFSIELSSSVNVPKSGAYFISASSYPSDNKMYFRFIPEHGEAFSSADRRTITLDATTYRVIAVITKEFIEDNGELNAEGKKTVTLKPQLRLGTTELTYTPYVNPSTVTVKKYGKNLVDITAITLSGSHNGPIDGGRRLDAVPYRGQKITWQTYVDTSKLSSNYTGSIIAKLFFYAEDGNVLKTATGNGITIKSNSHISYISFSVPNDATQVSLFVLITVAPNDGESVTFKENMLSIGDGVAEYEPYKEPTTFTVAADGTVEGVVSSDLYPDATLVPDTHGVNIAAEYNKDTDKVIQSLVDAIISLGGNV